MSVWKAPAFTAQPIYEILEDTYSGDITLLVVNARHMKNVSDKQNREFRYLIQHGCI